jgi:hypothetical protein
MEKKTERSSKESGQNQKIEQTSQKSKRNSGEEAAERGCAKGNRDNEKTRKIVNGIGGEVRSLRS